MRQLFVFNKYARLFVALKLQDGKEEEERASPGRTM